MSSVVATQSGAYSVGVASSSIASKNIGRREITVCNDHATQIVYLQLVTVGDVAPTAVVGQGIRLNAAGGSWTSDKYDGAVAAIATGAATNVTVVEY